MRPRDTHPDAYEFQMRVYRRLSPQQRGEIAGAMSGDIRRIASDGIRHRHPEYSEEEIVRALVELLYGEQVAAAIWPRR